MAKTSKTVEPEFRFCPICGEVLAHNIHKFMDNAQILEMCFDYHRAQDECE